MHTVLIANRGEIAVRVIRACRDAGLRSVAVYADEDRDAPHATMADEAYALDGTSAAATYLDAGKLLDVAARSGADAVHPGYGFLSENADFAQAVIDAGLTWIGPPPQAIRDLGDKVTARHLALRVGAPLVPGTEGAGVRAGRGAARSPREHGLPIAIKAAFGGGGRGLKVARSLDEIPHLYESAVREAVAAFGRGECFVERYLDRPRHVEAQVLADAARHGDRRRHPRLLAAAALPEARGGGSRAVPDAGAAVADSRCGAGDLRGGRLPRGRHGRVPRRRRRIGVVPRGQHAAAGRAPGHRGDERQSTWCASSFASPRVRSCAGAPICRPAATASSFGSTRRIPGARSCPPRAR